MATIVTIVIAVSLETLSMVYNKDKTVHYQNVKWKYLRHN